MNFFPFKRNAGDETLIPSSNHFQSGPHGYPIFVWDHFSNFIFARDKAIFEILFTVASPTNCNDGM